MATYEYTYFDYLSNAYETYYDYYYETVYWPEHYGSEYNGTYPPSQYVFRHPKMEYINPFLYAFIILMAILSIMIAVFACFKMFKEQCNNVENGEMNKIVLCLTLFCIFVHLLQNLTSTVLYYKMYIAFDPKLSFKILLVWDIFFCLTRISIYALFIFRFYLIFQAQRILYPASACYKRTLFTIAVFIMLVQCTFYVFYVVIFYGFADFGHPDILTLWKNIYWAFLALDFCFIGALGYLLSRSILTVINDMQHLCVKPKGVIIKADARIKSAASTCSSEINLAQYVDSSNHTAIDLDLTVCESGAFDTEITTSTKKEKRHKSKLGGELVSFATKITLLVMISMASSFIYQFLWMLSYEYGNLHLLLFSYTWCFDGVTNMVCIYLSLGLAKSHYKMLCFDICRCHQCALKCITKVADVKTVDI